MKDRPVTIQKNVSRNSAFQLEKRRCQNGWKGEENEWGTSIKLLFIQRGSASLQIQASKFELVENELLYVESSRSFRLAYEADTIVWILKISSVWLYSVMPDLYDTGALLMPSMRIERGKEKDDLDRLMQESARLFEYDDEIADIGINGLMFLIVYRLALYLSRHPEQKQSARTVQDPLKGVIRYLHANYTKPITLQELADEMHCTPQYISKLFQQGYGMTYKTYLTKLRLEQAVYEIEHTTKSHAEISMDCGFPSQHAFIQAFKRHYEMTPGKYAEMKKDS